MRGWVIGYFKSRLEDFFIGGYFVDFISLFFSFVCRCFCFVVLSFVCDVVSCVFLVLIKESFF